jgi:hypothetical protein
MGELRTWFTCDWMLRRHVALVWLLRFQSRERTLREKCLQSAMFVRRLRGDLIRSAKAAKDAGSEETRLSKAVAELQVSPFHSLQT